MLTTGTRSAAQVVGSRLGPGTIHQYVPADLSKYVRRFLDHWRPDLAIWLESEFWPNLVLETAERRTPMLLLNASLSAKSHRRWFWAPGLIRPVLASFNLALAQSEEAASRLLDHGARRVMCVGNLKYAAPPLPADEAALVELEAALAGRPRWLAASTHDREEEIAGHLHKALKSRFPGLVTLIAPRHPKRGAALARLLRADGLQVARRGKGEAIGPETDVYLADTLGEMGVLYRLASIVFVGGSLIPHGGQNPLEPARLGSAIVFGPHMGNFTGPVTELNSARAAETVADEDELTEAVARLLSDPAEVGRRVAAAQRVGAGASGMLEVFLDEIRPFLPVKAG